MLKISLKKGETVWIGEDITVTVLPNDRGATLLGIDAPREVDISRESPAKGRDETGD